MKQQLSKHLSITLSLLWVVSLFIFPAPVSAVELPQEVETPKLDVLCIDPPAGLISWWPGNGNAQDLIGNNHGLIMNGAAFAAGMVGQAFSLDGVDDYISIPKVNTWDFGSTSFSINAWFKSDTGGYRNIIRYDSGVANSGLWGVRFNPENKLEFIVSDSSRTVYAIVTDNTYTDNSWHLVSAVRDSVNGKLKIYIDGSPAAADAGDGASNIIGSAAAQLWIGGGAWGGEYLRVLLTKSMSSTVPFRLRRFTHCTMQAARVCVRPPVSRFPLASPPGGQGMVPQTILSGAMMAR